MAKGITISSLVVLAIGLLWTWTAGVQLAEAADPGEAAKLLKEAGFPDMTGNKAQGFVLAGQLVGITELLNGTEKADVLSALVLSKLASDVKYDFKNDLTHWYKFDMETLSHLGWTIQSTDANQHFTPTTDKVTINEALENLLGKKSTKTQMAVLTKILDAFKKFPVGDSRLTLFENTAGSGKMTVHLISKSSESVVMTSGFIVFHVPSKVSHLLSHEWDRAQVQVYALALNTMVLNDSLYAGLRVQVAQKLKDKGGMSQVIKDANI